MGGVVGLGRGAQPDGGFVFLVGPAEQGRQPGGASDDEGEDSGGERIERSGVTDP
jgi:hypothetical protein